MLDLEFIDTKLPHQFMGVHFLNDTVGYVVSYQAGIFKTTNGGYTWTQQESNTKMPLYDVQFLNDSLGFAAGGTQDCRSSTCKNGGVVLRTTNGGRTWVMTSAKTTRNSELFSVCFINNSVGFASGQSTLLTTRDQGKTWKETIISKLESSMQDIQFADQKNGLIECQDRLLKTSDGGETWEILTPFTSKEVGGSFALSVVNNRVAYYAGYVSGYGTFKTQDFASSLTRINNQPIDAFKLVFVNEKVGYAVGRGQWIGGHYGRSSGSIYCTNNGGKTWTGSDMIKETDVIWNAHFPNENLGYALSNNVIVKIRRR